LKIPGTNQQINKAPESSSVDPADNQAGRKKIEQQPKKSDVVSESSAIKTDTVQLSRESQALANSDKAKSGDKVAPEQKVINENSLVELLKMSDEQSGIFSGSKIDFLL
jgi:hypothetical protein